MSRSAAVTMTIRDYIKQRVRGALAVFVGCSTLIALLVQVPGSEAVKTGGAMVLTIIAMAGYLSALWVRCPKCRANLSMTIAIPVALRLFCREINCCPYCATKLDEPMQNPRG